MMPIYRLANLSHDQMISLERMEHEIGATLVAYEPEGDGAATNNIQDADENLVTDALLDTYRTYDPEI